jgi:hypothetical protein
MLATCTLILYNFRKKDAPPDTKFSVYLIIPTILTTIPTILTT